MTSPKVQTPRPTPLFFQPPLTFSTKKERGQTPKVVPPPRPPIKSAPPLSRIFPRKQLLKALPVSFKSPEKTILSPHYNASNKELFFDQCFDVECRIGVGSFGEVFKVRSKEDGRLYAVKRSRQRFRGESDRHRKLEEVDKHESLPFHPNCVGFVKAWEESGHLYIQTELCKTSLNVFAEENHSIPEEIIWNYLVDLLMAVRHLHDHDLVHMDIKPENIFISFNDICKLGDFGLVLDLNKDVEVRDAQEGDPKYLAPELMMGKFGKPADVFSLGITILEIAVDLDLPRGGDLWHQLRSGILPEQLILGISDELKTIIRQMMEPDPLQRPTVNQILEHEYVVQIWNRRLADISALKEGSWMDLPASASQSSATFNPPVTTPSGDEATKHLPNWDYSYSDDDSVGCLGNSSLGMVRLDLSASSDESAKSHNNSFVIPGAMPRRALTTPRHKRRRGDGSKTDISSSPPLFKLSADDVFSSSPVNPGMYRVHTVEDAEKLCTPSPIVSSDMEVDDDAVPEKITVEPKNLMKAFESTLRNEAPD